jgi:hypothetical protein
VTDFVEIEPSAPGDPDWTILGLPGVMEVAEKAARKVAFDYSVAIEEDDALQEALIMLATRQSLRDCLHNEALGLGALHHALYSDLVDKVKREAEKRCGHVSYEASREGRE